MESSLREKPEHHRPRRLSDHLKLSGKLKVHSLVDKVYKPRNLQLAWERVRTNRGSGGIDGVSLEEFGENLEEHLQRLHNELRSGNYRPEPVRRVHIPKRGSPGKTRPLGIPNIYDRVCQQALLNRLEPIFEQTFDPSSFGYRKGRKPQDALRKIWLEVDSGQEWIVDADLKDYFGSVDHDKLMALIAQRVSDGKVLKLIKQTLEAGALEGNRFFPGKRGTPQGGVVSPLLSNILLTPFDKEMRTCGYRLTRWADDWVVTCRTRQEAQSVLARARKILLHLGVTLNMRKTRIVHIRNGFEFLGFKIKQGHGNFYLPKARIKSKITKKRMYAIPTQKSVDRFKHAIRCWTNRKTPRKTQDLIEQINPIIRGWGNYYKRSHVRRRFNQLDRWIVRRLWSHRYKRWRNIGWKVLPAHKLREELGLVGLVSLIPTITAAPKGARS
jgi:RNA-directed DNA polymerase